ncbi:uncharacterized protein DUF1173 [Rhizobium sp. PP-F2F-G36]|nr:uncharacterized protein DUF1173 [Rhizobium sp. PP-F2F-G36]
MRKIRIGGSDVTADASDFARRLSEAFDNGERPLCLCQPDGVPMYVARSGKGHILKRMPGSGARHGIDCDSYEVPAALSGLGEVDGKAIVESEETGETQLKLGFSLTKLTGRNASEAARNAAEADSVKTDGSRLSLRALLHFLWDQAEFNRWRPAMEKRRNWAVIRKYLMQAAEGKTAKGKGLADMLYIPEFFDVDKDTEIVARRDTFLSKTVQSQGKRRSLALLIGEVKEVAPARVGARMAVKHAPRFPFMLPDDLHRRMNRVFETELALWNATEGSHLIAAATFGVDAAGIASVEEIALMVVTDRWIPFDSRYDLALLDALTLRGASFVKSLRYNQPRSTPMASLVLRPDRAPPIAMYIVPEDADEAYGQAREALAEESGMASWVWSIRDGAMPDLPG